MTVMDEARSLTNQMIERAHQRVTRRLMEDHFGERPSIINASQVNAAVTARQGVVGGQELNVRMIVHFSIRRAVSTTGEIHVMDTSRMVSPLKVSEKYAAYEAKLTVNMFVDDLELARGGDFAWGKVLSGYAEKLQTVEMEIADYATSALKEQGTTHHAPHWPNEDVYPPRPKAHSKPTAKRSAPKITHDEGFGAW